MKAFFLIVLFLFLPPLPPKPAPTFDTLVWEAAKTVDASEYAILKDNGPILTEGVLMGLGANDGMWIGPGDQVPKGIWLNVTDDTAMIIDANGDNIFDMSANGVIGISSKNSESPPPIIIQPGNGGKVVICKDGYYACCMEAKDGVKATARCRRDTDKDEDCDAGGKGSVSCTITEK